MQTPNIQPFQKILPMIYAYTTPNDTSHIGWTKIGEARKQTVEKRIKQQTNTADTKTILEWKREARYTDGSGEYFFDHDFHDYLTHVCHVERLRDAETHKLKEWFRIAPEKAKQLFYDFQSRDWKRSPAFHVSYILRDEQEEAVQKTLAYFQSDAEPKEFLWNAKPRFGKTLAAYELVLRLQAQNVLVVTNRPSIANAWLDDFERFIAPKTALKFVSESDALAKQNVMTRKKYTNYLTAHEAEEKHLGCIEFESLQALKGAKCFGGDIDKLDWIATLPWDLLIIDESHEGAATPKASFAFERIHHKYALYLSGTPFKAIANHDFREEQIYNWSYTDEQTAKEKWQGEEANPYENLPRLSMFTYRLADMTIERINMGVDLSEKGRCDFAFDLNTFFETKAGGSFVHETEVRRFLDALTQGEKFPFSTETLRNELRHTFWILERVSSAKALAKLLRTHPIFQEYEIILAAGDGKEDNEEAKNDTAMAKSYNRVKEAIAKHEKTITLSVGQLTTGVTIPEWTAVLMLSNMKSAAAYMQAAFRAQNPYSYSDEDGLHRKENAYLFDFAPERTLKIYEEFANDLLTSTAQGRGTKEAHEENVRRLLNFFPVYGEGEQGTMEALNAEEVLRIPRLLKAHEVVRRGFLSNFLFQNISNLFSAPASVREILEKITPVAVGKDKGLTMEYAEGLFVNEKGEVDVPQDIIMNRTEAIFGQKIYEDVDKAVTALQETFAAETPANYPAQDFVEHATASVETALQNVMQKSIKEAYSLTTKMAERETRQATEAVKSRLQHLADTYKVEHYQAIREGMQAKKEAQSETEVELAETHLQQKMQELASTFQENLQKETQVAFREETEHITRRLEEHQEETRKQQIEEDARAHLRGFSRAIPSFLMAYGDENLCLANFDSYAPDDVFVEVTGITKAEFCYLRDGGEHESEQTGEISLFRGGFFDEEVFNTSIQEFLAKKDALADYFADENAEDIFDYIPPQRTNQIFTPRRVVQKMLDSLERENPLIFNDAEHTFVDFYMKSGLFITEVVKRLFHSPALQKLFPDERQRIQHILEHQVFGFAPTKIIHAIAMAYIFGFDKEQTIQQKNFVCTDVTPYVKDGKLETLLKETWKN